MRKGSISKYIIPNLPYLFILWACLKIGTAYRLAAGADFAHKLMGLMESIGPAFADISPGLNGFDWLVGIAGAVGFRLLIYTRTKNAKKFRRDAEYGSARWGTEKDIKPFVDPVFKNNVILTGTEFLTMNTRPKNPANARNLNTCIIGSSGSGKTRFWLTPQLLQASPDKKGGCSYCVVDPKGGVLSQVGHFLQKRCGYKIKVFNSIDFSKSMHYNPLSYIKNEADILKFVNTLINNTKGDGKEGDPFWTKAKTLLYCALIAYIVFEGPEEDRTINTLVDLISGMEVKEDDENYESTHSYDEYHYNLAEIEHSPYDLISILSALHEGAWTLADVQDDLAMLFGMQYILTEDVVVETRYYTETDTWTDEDGNTHTDTYEVPYDYYICTVTLKNEILSHLPILIMSEEQLSRFALYTATLGNRPDLFGGTVKEFTDYDVPEAYLTDETFKAILTEAEKYLGYPYIWGGSNPSTSFDCSGFVSWVINHSGWNVGRLGAQGLYNICTRTSSPRPGDLVFFVGTYDTPGVSHCGIYVGDGMMLHCGDPISYANLNTSYWQSHFYAYGRLP